jgi:anti-sigma factor RsiW
MASQPIDVVSTDRHTVKPWFGGRVPEAPRVADLAKEGFPLVGGRLDVVGRTPVPTLVYRYRNYLISLTAVPVSGVANATQVLHAVDGYSVVSWTNDGVAYWALSDISASVLEHFVQLFRGIPTDQ